jgi:hypothetical protein
MKKIVLIAIAFFTAQLTEAQTVIFSSNFQNWTAGTPDGWMGVRTNLPASQVAEMSGGEFGTKVVQLTETSSTHKRFTTQALSVTSGEAYEIKIWVKGSGEMRTSLHNGTDFQTYFNSAGVANQYDVINSQGLEQLSYTHFANASSPAAEFIISIRNTTGSHLQIDSVAILTSNATPPSAVSIYDIQYTTDPSGDSPLKDQVVNTGGIVYGTKSNGYYIADNTGMYSGIFVFDSFNTPAIGDSVTFTGTVVEYFNMTQMSSVTNFSIKSSSNAIHPAATIPTGDVEAEAYESCFVRVTNAGVTDTGIGFGMFLVNDGSGTCRIDDLLYAYTLPAINSMWTIQGPVDYSFSEYKILPRFASDMTSVSSTSKVEMNGIEVYPTISLDEINVVIPTEASVSMLSMDGKVLLSEQTSAGKHTFTTSNLLSGVYLITFETASTFNTVRFIKK